MREEDLDALVDICTEALWGPVVVADRPRQRRRISHLLATDPAGAWTAEDEGAPVGCALALRREGVWGLSLLALAEAHRGRGAGRRLLAAALGCAAGATGGIILSSEHPAAMRAYARAGFALRPAVSLTGLVTNPPERPAAVRDGGEADVRWADEVARAVRGAPYGDDLRWWLAGDGRLRCLDGRGWMVGRGPTVAALLALDADAARTLLEAHLADVGPGETAEVGFVGAGQDWAVRAGLEAGLALSPEGPIFTRGRLGSLAAWVPSGTFL